MQGVPEQIVEAARRVMPALGRCESTVYSEHNAEWQLSALFLCKGSTLEFTDLLVATGEISATLWLCLEVAA